MRYWLLAALVVAILLFMSNPLNANSSRFTTPINSVLPPFGYVDFCSRHPMQCEVVGGPERLDLSRELLDEIVAVNNAVNKSIKPIEDRDHYGIDEYWTIPVDNAGDCEEYVIMKRDALIRRGLSSSTLLITIVKHLNIDAHHAVLLLRTNRGDYVMDNLREEIVLWNAAQYKFIMRQSYVHPNLWVRLEP